MGRPEFKWDVLNLNEQKTVESIDAWYNKKEKKREKIISQLCSFIAILYTKQNRQPVRSQRITSCVSDCK